jgi:hypothetical protein
MIWLFSGYKLGEAKILCELWITLIILKVLSHACQALSCNIKKNKDTEFNFFLGSLPSCPPDDLFLCRLIQKDCVEGSSNNEKINYVEEALALRRLSTTELLKLIQDTVDDQMERIEDIGHVLHGDLSTEGIIIHLRYYAMLELYSFC